MSKYKYITISKEEGIALEVTVERMKESKFNQNLIRILENLLQRSKHKE